MDPLGHRGKDAWRNRVDLEKWLLSKVLFESKVGVDDYSLRDLIKRTSFAGNGHCRTSSGILLFPLGMEFAVYPPFLPMLLSLS